MKIFWDYTFCKEKDCKKSKPTLTRVFKNNEIRKSIELPESLKEFLKNEMHIFVSELNKNNPQEIDVF